MSNGPDKLCGRFEIDKNFNEKTVDESDLYLEDSGNELDIKIKTVKRIGVDYAKEAKDWEWRYILDL